MSRRHRPSSGISQSKPPQSAFDNGLSLDENNKNHTESPNTSSSPSYLQYSKFPKTQDYVKGKPSREDGIISANPRQKDASGEWQIILMGSVASELSFIGGSVSEKSKIQGEDMTVDGDEAWDMCAEAERFRTREGVKTWNDRHREMIMEKMGTSVQGKGKESKVDGDNVSPEVLVSEDLNKRRLGRERYERMLHG